MKFIFSNAKYHVHVIKILLTNIFLKINNFKIIILGISFSIVFSGCAASYNNVTQNLETNVKGIFSIERTMKVGVKKAYISKETDAKSNIISSVELNEKLLIIGLADNENWFKVVTPKKEGFIPKSAMIQVSITDSIGKTLSFLWSKVKNKKDVKTTTFTIKNKNWSDDERVRVQGKGYGENKQNYLTGKKPRYNEQYLDKFFKSLSADSSQYKIKSFRNSGGLK